MSRYIGMYVNDTFQEIASPKCLVQAVCMKGAAGLCILLAKLSFDFVQEGEGYLPSILFVCHHQVRCSITTSLSHLDLWSNTIVSKEAIEDSQHEAERNRSSWERRFIGVFIDTKAGHYLELADVALHCDIERLTVSPVHKVVECMMIAIEYDFGVGRRRIELVQALNRHSCKVACKV